MHQASTGIAAFLAAVAAVTVAHAQMDNPQAGIEAYREALQDGNPAELHEMAGEELWTTPAGPKNASLEQCDLGLGPGVVKGAYARLPRYFADTDRVQDLESRLLTCMETLQGKDPKVYIDASFTAPPKEEMNALVAYLSGQSRDVAVTVTPEHPKERAMYELGKRLFFFQGGPYDFSCATCHGQEGTRIRMQDLPYIPGHEGAAAGWTSWPAYRVSNGQMWSMQWRLNDCFRQQRFPEPIYASDATIALSTYIAANSNGAVMKTPGIKR
ncbi:sulfur oxidation c-type cytochrome SoxA [Azospirillum halopraeferens]|uniref:sulfur oxidation c-type cytochrome SoxA n=1 Tax=Azospirillum halopraeferens TaxID=34010 RepID=UPI000426C4E8|nr:sulfur oxidation c-type cytochrome SoxA [Azospirillum halopraeferens]